MESTTSSAAVVPAPVVQLSQSIPHKECLPEPLIAWAVLSPTDVLTAGISQEMVKKWKDGLLAQEQKIQKGITSITRQQLADDQAYVEMVKSRVDESSTLVNQKMDEIAGKIHDLSMEEALLNATYIGYQAGVGANALYSSYGIPYRLNQFSTHQKTLEADIPTGTKIQDPGSFEPLLAQTFEIAKKAAYLKEYLLAYTNAMTVISDKEKVYNILFYQQDAHTLHADLAAQILDLNMQARGAESEIVREIDQLTKDLTSLDLDIRNNERYILSNETHLKSLQEKKLKLKQLTTFRDQMIHRLFNEGDSVNRLLAKFKASFLTDEAPECQRNPDPKSKYYEDVKALQKDVARGMEGCLMTTHYAKVLPAGQRLQIAVSTSFRLNKCETKFGELGIHFDGHIRTLQSSRILLEGHRSDLQNLIGRVEQAKNTLDELVNPQRGGLVSYLNPLGWWSSNTPVKTDNKPVKIDLTVTSTTATTASSVQTPASTDTPLTIPPPLPDDWTHLEAKPAGQSVPTTDLTATQAESQVIASETGVPPSVESSVTAPDPVAATIEQTAAAAVEILPLTQSDWANFETEPGFHSAALEQPVGSPSTSRGQPSVVVWDTVAQPQMGSPQRPEGQA